MKHYPIYEWFHSFQGEGTHMGRSAFFIRTYGCPIQCPWCDSMGTWHPHHKPAKVDKYTPERLLNIAQSCKADFAVLTGGEPTIFNLHPLTETFKQADIKIHLETSGAFPIQGVFDWITLSPKWQKLPMKENLQRANEIKIIVDHKDSISQWWKYLQDAITTEHVWLHPEWSLSNKQEILNTITQWIKDHGSPFRAGYQIHKAYQADALDLDTRRNDSLWAKNSPTCAV